MTDYRLYVAVRDPEKSLERQMSYRIRSVLINCWNITKPGDECRR